MLLWLVLNRINSRSTNGHVFFLMDVLKNKEFAFSRQFQNLITQYRRLALIWIVIHYSQSTSTRYSEGEDEI